MGQTVKHDRTSSLCCSKIATACDVCERTIMTNDYPKSTNSIRKD